eukprot:3063992-Alexandrium_andersonii.AAC.1
MQPFYHVVKVSSRPKIQPEGAAVQASPTGQSALSVARNSRKSETHSTGPSAEGALLRTAPPAPGSE